MIKIAIIDSEKNFNEIWTPLLQAQGHTCALHEPMHNPVASRPVDANGVHIVICNYDHEPRPDLADVASSTGSNGRAPYLIVSRNNASAAERYAARTGNAFIPMPFKLAALSWLVRFALDRATKGGPRQRATTPIPDSLGPTARIPAPTGPRNVPAPASTQY